jgi:CRP-like cAMP-binding protein
VVRAKAIDRVATLALDRSAFFAFLQQHPQAAIELLPMLPRRKGRGSNRIVSDGLLTVGTDMPKEVYELMGLYPQTAQRRLSSGVYSDYGYLAVALGVLLASMGIPRPLRR